ncbi:MAG TPA: helix-turn-helix domain-containing protein [Actinomycetota bacterium]|nr:helix-turn-helix domain-containing protein [Actinomycetota bacterium]
MSETNKGRRITGAERQALTKDIVDKYTQGASIRQLAEETGRSYGFIHRLLVESGTTLRGRGGSRGQGE